MVAVRHTVPTVQQPLVASAPASSKKALARPMVQPMRLAQSAVPNHAVHIQTARHAQQLVAMSVRAARHTPTATHALHTATVMTAQHVQATALHTVIATTAQATAQLTAGQTTAQATATATRDHQLVALQAAR